MARDREVASIGVDAEPNEPLPGTCSGWSPTPPSGPGWPSCWRPPAVSWDRLLFSAKESVYKAWFPLTLRWLDFARRR